ncbi:MAG: aminotransferase class III-fold pyridoxal phosphate-dependent enzyme, partial [Bacteroidales bacterium]|nr:aminotransferase class III-fold pyridoxal phosphate-dependent enzyme [Bacteroidales bacterium]
ENLVTKADQNGKLFEEALLPHPAIKEIRRAGLMLGVEVAESIEIDQLMKAFKKNKLVVDQFLFHEKAFRIAPPLTISENEIRESIHLVIKSLDQVLNT